MTKFLAALAAALLAACAHHQESGGPYAESAAAANRLMRDHHYNPRELNRPAYRKIERAVVALGETATSDKEFIDGYNALWRGGPFSHVSMGKAQQSAADLAAYLDSMRIGGGGARLSWEGDAAILTVTTMMGLDTIEEIDAAYDEIAARGAKKLIIDLRKNGGGAFAVLPLVSHLIAEPYDAGSFVARRWNAANTKPPARADVLKVEPWTGWSIIAFWRDVQEDALLRIRFSPTEPRYDGPVYVLTSAKTASAAELAADALKGSKRAVIIGERTAGEMLSQTIYDVPGGFQLSLPIADYYSLASGRIEGVGVAPDIAVAADEALAAALAQ